MHTVPNVNIIRGTNELACILIRRPSGTRKHANIDIAEKKTLLSPDDIKFRTLTSRKCLGNKYADLLPSLFLFHSVFASYLNQLRQCLLRVKRLGHAFTFIPNVILLVEIFIVSAISRARFVSNWQGCSNKRNKTNAAESAAPGTLRILFCSRERSVQKQYALKSIIGKTKESF